MADSVHIGPYRVIRRLGSGGMAEVVLAHDERLKRLVAIKRLHSDHAATPERRERLRREARIAARLNSPAIVQLHDVIQEGEHDYLIMEYVDGQTLRQRWAAGPMTMSEVLDIAHQIALGMATAHDLGVVHRDLKPENILITLAGRAKIADFGIAKLDGDDTITTDGAVIGTFLAMSPEQAQGHAVDHRSDLFSFGILLYEALAGVSPFRADTTFLTMQRLVAEDPRPIAELVPSIPHGLASLVRQLLAKEPRMRPRSFHEVATALTELGAEPRAADALPGHRRPASDEDTQATDDRVAPAGPRPAGTERSLVALADTVDASASGRGRPAPPHHRRYAAIAGVAALSILGIGSLVWDRRTADPPAPPLPVPAPSPHKLIRVAVLEADVGTDCPPDAALHATAIRSAVMTAVRMRIGLDIIPQTDIDAYVNGGKPKMDMVRNNVGADEVIAIHILCVRYNRKITLERAYGPISPPESFQLPSDSAWRPDETVAAHVNKLYPDHPAREGAKTGSLDPRDYDRYRQLLQSYWTGKTPSISDVLAELEVIRERSPGSLDVLLFEAQVRRHWYLQTQEDEQARRATDLLERADKLFPDTYGILSARFDIALDRGKLDDAGAVLKRLEVLDPDSSPTHLQRAKLHYKRGELHSNRHELEQARDELAAAAQRDSFSWRVPYYRARVAKSLDDKAARRTAIDDLLRRSPNNYAGLSLRAREEFDAGRLACAEQIYAQLVAREPLYDECSTLGYVRNQLGKFREAAQSLRCALQFRPRDPVAKLNLAESLVLADDQAASRSELRELRQILSRKKGLTGGLETVERMIEAQTLAYLGRDDPELAREARKRTDELLNASTNPGRHILYTAALVHALLGDRDQTAKYVERYLHGGGGSDTFSLRWFDDLRRDPTLGPRLSVPPVARSCAPSPTP